MDLDTPYVEVIHCQMKILVHHVLFRRDLPPLKSIFDLVIRLVQLVDYLNMLDREDFGLVSICDHYKTIPDAALRD